MSSETYRTPIILMYHSVRDNVNGGSYGIEISPARFERHIAFVTARYRVVPLVEFVDALGSGARADGMAAITFDDGFADNLGVASDILRKFAAPATVFVPTSFINRGYFWWDALPRFWAATPTQLSAVNEEVRALLPGSPDSPLAADANQQRAMHDRLRRRPLDDVYRFTDRIAGLLGISLADLPRPATDEELPQFARWPFNVGSHGVSHPALPSLAQDTMREELRASRAFLEERIGSQVRTFSYPFGLADRDVVAACRDAGYAAAVTCLSGPDQQISYSDRLALPRVNAGFGDVDELTRTLDKYEECNKATYTVGRALDLDPTQLSPERRSLYKNSEISSSKDRVERSSDLFRDAPFERDWGSARGPALDRPYINQFMRRHAGDIRGRVLEVKSPEFFSAYARPGAKVDILDINPTNSAANIVDDLQLCGSIADNTYDCVILTQVLQYIPDCHAVMRQIARILKPGGVLLLTAPGITQTVQDNDGDFFWSFFEPGIGRVLAEHFDERRTLTHSYGNVGIAASFLMGVTVPETPPDLFSLHDREYPIVVTARAMKPLPMPDEIEWPEATAEPRVSVVIPLFNAEGTIKETLHSVSRQSHQSYEIIIVDDGSTDRSRWVAEDLAERSRGRISVVTHSDRANHGLALTRNLGLERARGEFVVFLDSDDTIHPEKLAHDLDILDAHPRAAAVVGRALWWWAGAGKRDAHMDDVVEPHDRIVDPPTFFNETFKLRTGGSPPCVHSWMIRKSVLKAIEPFDPEMMTFEDQKFLAEISLRFPVYVASACLCEYRRKESTLWADAVSSGSGLIALERFEDWLAKACATSPQLQSPVA
jgi:peptidoglycan/xylan/chitin deacetylase (PgdA/CDA1 family)